jgi:hypothetical protein
LATSGSANIEAHLHVLAAEEGYDGSPLYSGSRAVFRCHEVVDDVRLLLVGASQLASGENGTARLSFSNPRRHQAYLREGLEFDILDRGKRRIGRGTVAALLDMPDA